MTDSLKITTANRPRGCHHGELGKFYDSALKWFRWRSTTHSGKFGVFGHGKLEVIDNNWWFENSNVAVFGANVAICSCPSLSLSLDDTFFRVRHNGKPQICRWNLDDANIIPAAILLFGGHIAISGFLSTLSIYLSKISCAVVDVWLGRIVTFVFIAPYKYPAAAAATTTTTTTTT